MKNPLRDLQKHLDQISGDNEVPLEEIYPADFMQSHTEFRDIHEFLEASPINTETQESFNEADSEDLDPFTEEHTDFDSYEDMAREAVLLWAKKKLGL